MFAHIVLMLPLFLGGCHDNGNGQPTLYESDIVVLETLLEQDGKAVEVDVRNGSINIKSIGINKIAKRGRNVVPSLLRVMQTHDLSFDTFARCFVACQRIATAENPSTQLFWQGGADERVLDGGRVKLFSRGEYLNEVTFRKQVIDDIQAKLLAPEKK